MPNRLIFSIRFFSKVFWKYTFIAITMLAFFYLFRMNLYFLSIYHAVPDAVPMDIALAFVAGFRFDLSLLSWMLAPLLLLLVIQAFTEAWSKGLVLVHKHYLTVFWILSCLISLVDFIHFSKTGTRAGFQLYSLLSFSQFWEQLGALNRNNGWIFLGISSLLMALGLFLIWSAKFGSWKDEYSPHRGGLFEILFRVSVPLILVAIMAHGTYNNIGLTEVDAQVSTFLPINEMAKNPVLTIVKSFFTGDFK